MKKYISQIHAIFTMRQRVHNINKGRDSTLRAPFYEKMRQNRLHQHFGCYHFSFFLFVVKVSAIMKTVVVVTFFRSSKNFIFLLVLKENVRKQAFWRKWPFPFSTTFFQHRCTSMNITFCQQKLPSNRYLPLCDFTLYIICTIHANILLFRDYDVKYLEQGN